MGMLGMYLLFSRELTLAPLKGLDLGHSDTSEYPLPLYISQDCQVKFQLLPLNEEQRNHGGQQAERARPAQTSLKTFF